MYLLDTNVVSELRKVHTGKANPQVVAWASSVAPASLFLSAISVLELETGLMLDSLDTVELVVVVEKHFGVAIADAEEARKAFTSVSGLADFICARKAQA